MRQTLPAMPGRAKLYMEVTAHRVTVPKAKADARAAPSRMIRSSRWSVIRDCARLSSRAARNWARLTGGETYPVGRCPIRKSRMSLHGWPRTECQPLGSPIRPPIMRIRSQTMSTKPVLVPASETAISRRGFFMKLGILFNGLAAAVVAVPIVGFLFSAITRGRANGYLSWVQLGKVADFPEGETRLATFRNPYVMPTDGKTADTACWVRHIAGEQFQVFAINCAHLGCPVRWFQQSGLFMCPCHGGAYYSDGSRASGPPERGLFEYPYKIENGLVTIQAGELPTPGAAMAALTGEKPTCA